MDLDGFKIRLLPLQDKLLAFALRLLGDREEARDAVQEVYLKMWRMREELDKYRKPEAFAMTVTRNHCLDKIKARRTERLEEKHINREDNRAGDDPHDLLKRKDALTIVKEIIKDLPEKQRSVIHLRDVEGLDNEEVAVIMGMDVNNVRVVLSRTRKLVREKLVNKYYSNGNKGSKTAVGEIL